MEACSVAIQNAIKSGITGEQIINEVATLCCFDQCPKIVAVALKTIGRDTQFNGITLSHCTATELVYVNARWVPGKSFFSICEPGWARRFERFLRTMGHPIIISRHGKTRDRRIIADAMKKEHIMASPISAGCASLAKNAAFPHDIDEIPSFLNVLNITPHQIICAAA